jgi:hypothetical protein
MPADPTAPLPDEECPGLVDHPSSIGVRRHVPAKPDLSGIHIEDCLIKDLEAPYLAIPAALDARNITIRNCSIKPNGRGGILVQSRSDD